MHHALWTARKNYLYTLVKKVSKGFGGDDNEFLIEHFEEIIKTHQEEKIEEAIRCYEQMAEQIKNY